MKILLKIAGFVAFLPLLFAKPYDVDYSHSSVDFTVKHLLVTKVRGFFQNFTAKIDVNNGKLREISGEILSDSISTRNTKRDNHVKADEFLGTENNPKITFRSTKIDDDDVYGVLTIKGVSRNVKLDLDMNKGRAPDGRVFYALELDGDISRKDFNVGTTTPNAVISDKIELKIVLEAYEK